MSWRDVPPIPNELLGEDEQARNIKLAMLVQRIRTDNPDVRPHGLSGETECPLCGSVVAYSILSNGSVYASCATMGCVTLHSRASAGDLKRPAKPDTRRRLF